MPTARHLSRAVALVLALSGVGLAAQTTVSHVVNTATLSFAGDTGRTSVASNTVSLDVAPAKRPTSFTFHLLPPGYELTGMKCETAPVMQFTPAVIDADVVAKAPLLKTVDIHSSYIVVLDYQGDKRDPTVRERVEVSVRFDGKTIVAPFVETAPDSGVFAGGVPAAGTHPELAACDPTVQRSPSVSVAFSEDQFSYASSLSLLIDPAGFVFDSATAALVDGARVTLLDASGQPATVFGDDGVSRYPSSVVSGEAVTDASGRTYPAIKGRYRFPLAPPGSYTLKVEPPSPYVAPSTRDPAQVAALKDAAGAPFLLNGASYGGTLTLADQRPFYADIPVDTGAGGAAAPSLRVTKTASVRQASPGDFVQYHLTLANRGKGAATGIHVADTLPVGLRYQRGSTRGASEPVAAPVPGLASVR